MRVPTDVWFIFLIAGAGQATKPYWMVDRDLGAHNWAPPMLPSPTTRATPCARDALLLIRLHEAKATFDIMICMQGSDRRELP